MKRNALSTCSGFCSLSTTSPVSTSYCHDGLERSIIGVFVPQIWRCTLKFPIKAALKNSERLQRMSLCVFQTRSRHLTVQSDMKPDSKILQG